MQDVSLAETRISRTYMHSFTLPEFPKFERLSVQHKGAIDAYFNLYPPYSDFTFATMWCWDLYNSAALSVLNGNLVLRSKNYKSGLPYLSFLGGIESCKTVLTLLEYSEDELARSQLDRIPEISISHDAKGLAAQLEIQEDRNNFDYIFDLQALASFVGPSYQSKRKLAAHFERTYSPKVRELDLNDSRDREMVLSVFTNWSDSRGKSRIDTEKELCALYRAFKIWSTGVLVAIGVSSDDRLIAFAVCEILPNRFAVGHFFKADTRLKGAFEFLRQVQARHLLQLGFKWLNIQQDMGLPGLRQAKMSYCPIFFLRKYTLTTCPNMVNLNQS